MPIKYGKITWGETICAAVDALKNANDVNNSWQQPTCELVAKTPHFKIQHQPSRKVTQPARHAVPTITHKREDLSRVRVQYSTPAMKEI